MEMGELKKKQFESDGHYLRSCRPLPIARPRTTAERTRWTSLVVNKQSTMVGTSDDDDKGERNPSSLGTRCFLLTYREVDHGGLAPLVLGHGPRSLSNKRSKGCFDRERVVRSGIGASIQAREEVGLNRKQSGYPGTLLVVHTTPWTRQGLQDS